MRHAGPVTGSVYSRSAHDSTVVSRVILSDSAASPLAKRLVRDLLTRGPFNSIQMVRPNASPTPSLIIYHFLNR